MKNKIDINILLRRTKNLEKEISNYKFGYNYDKLKKEKHAVYVRLSREIRKWEKKYANLVKAKKNEIQKWRVKFKSLEKYYKQKILLKDNAYSILEYKIKNQETYIQNLKASNSNLEDEINELKKKIHENEGTIKKLEIQANKDFTNSSYPSSAQSVKRKKIPNTREKTDKKIGAQPGHKHHPRKKLEATKKVKLKDPVIFKEDPNLYKTKDTISKSVISVKLFVEVTEYTANIWRNRNTGARVHASFPEGVKDEVNYDSTVKALAFMLTHQCCVSIPKTKEFITELSNGKLELSSGLISNLSHEFYKKSESERNEIYEKLTKSEVLHADFTGANVDGNMKQVLVLSNGKLALMQGKNSKGHKGIKDSPLEYFVNCLVHDHDKTFYSYGNTHQECMQHNIRYLIGSIENEPDFTWNKDMLKLIREMIHAKNEDNIEDPDKYSKKYDEILEIAHSEYSKSPPNKYYRDGYNLYKRLIKYKESQIRFIYESNVPADNSICERLARVFKRKLHQAIVFRSFKYLEYTCNALSFINNKKAYNKNVIQELNVVFSRPLKISTF